jgi:16S rRNA (cytosine1402-N4)-methyltransferase
MLPIPDTEESPLGRSGTHEPVLLRETVELLAPRPGGTIVDATLGSGGHAEPLLEALGPDGRLLGIDRDPVALEIARQRLARFGERFTPLRGNHSALVDRLHAAGTFVVDGILFDLGLSSMQVDDPERGFSFRADGPLDMRMDPDSPLTAAGFLAACSEPELQRVLRDYGEERMARAIARAVVRARTREPITRTGQLAAIVERVLGARARRFRIHPATRTFQALRIAVNGEVDYLPSAIHAAVSVLRRGGRVAVISYHSLEDRAVKRCFRDLAERCTCPRDLPVCGCGRENLVRVVTRRAVRPGPAETADNPRSRSARLRVAERL